MTTLSEIIADLKSENYVQAVRFTSKIDIPEFEVQISGDPPSPTENIQKWSIVTLQVVKIKNAEAQVKDEEYIVLNFGCSDEEAYQKVAKWSS